MSRSAAALEMQKASATIGLFWEQRTKRWAIRALVGQRLVTLANAETAREIDESGLFLIASAVKEEMEAWVL